MGNSLNWKQTLAFLLLFVPSLIFYALQNRVGTWAEGTPLQTPAHWIQNSFDLGTQIIQENMNTYFHLVATNRLNRELKVENAKLASKVLLLEEYRSENIRLRELFKFQKELSRKSLAARVIAKDVIDDRKSFSIDKGSLDGVKRLQGVITAEGAVGYTIEVEPHSSRILLLSNKNTSVDAIIQRTRARGIVSGEDHRRYLLKHLMRQDDAKIGDEVVTSGSQGVFPKGFRIGKVTKVKSSPTGVSYVARIQPAVRLDQLEQVLVLVHNSEGQAL